jgi:hypothetical protein
VADNQWFFISSQPAFPFSARTSAPKSVPFISKTDETLERIYLGRRFKNDTERLEKLFELSTKMTAHAPSARKAARRKNKGR